MFSSELSLPSCLLDDLDNIEEDLDQEEESMDGVVGIITSVDNDNTMVINTTNDKQVYIKTKSVPIVEIGEKVSFNGEHLITHPDLLLPATLLADSFTCMRRACLSALTQPAVEDNKPSISLVIGSLVHNVIQELLMVEESLSDDQLAAKISSSIDKYSSTLDCLLSLYACDGTIEEVKQQAHEMLNNGQFYCWFQDLKRNNLVVDVEESFWATNLGLKGKIDASLQSLLDGQCWPLEIKTSKYNQNNINHRGQTLIYTLLLQDRREEPVSRGLLYYVPNNESINVSVRPIEVEGIMKQRNALARFISQGAQDLLNLPDVLQNDHACQRCFQRDTCLSAQALDTESSATLPPSMNQRFQELFANISDQIVQFCLKYLRAIAAEEEECLKSRMVLWNTPTNTRLQMGRCVRVVVEQSVPGKGDRHQVQVHCVDRFTDSWLNVGDAIVISECRRVGKMVYGISIGYLLSVHHGEDDTTTLTLSLDRALSTGKSYIVDKDELTGSFGVLRANMCKLLVDKRLADQIVNFKPPQFITTPIELEETSILDEGQRRAVGHVLSAQDYALIVGMPGTGKTTTLAAIIGKLIAQGQSILLVSHTHAAIDNVLLKMISMFGQEFVHNNGLRLGPVDRVNCKLAAMTELPTCQQGLHARLNTVQLVAGTTMSTQHHPLFMKRRLFSWCIVDEATQLSLPACLGAIRFGAKFLLVGDPYQLPPLVRSRHVNAQPLANSLHHILLEAHPQAAATLHQQYRMCEEIQMIPNHLVYKGQLSCANESVRSRRLCIQSDDPIIDPNRPVVFIDTDKDHVGECEEIRVGTSYCNPKEAEIVVQLVKKFINAGLPSDSIAVISPFRPQLRLLRAKIEHVELATVDRFQGRDFPCVIVSLVRSNPLQMVGDLVSDWQRINVAFTRAQSKLIVIGSRSTLSSSSTFSLFLQLVDSQGWQALSGFVADQS